MQKHSEIQFFFSIFHKLLSKSIETETATHPLPVHFPPQNLPTVGAGLGPKPEAKHASWFPL